MPEKEAYEEKIISIEEELSKTKKNKATNKHIGILRAKIAKAKRELLSIKKYGGYGFFVKKGGDATASLVGFPSSGKSSLINELTSITSKTAEYAFTTTEVVEGTMVYRDSHIQILDLPGILEYAHSGFGKGLPVLAQVRNSNLAVFVVEVKNTNQLASLMEELKKVGIFINKQPPSIKITKSNTPLKIVVNKSGLNSETIKEIFNGLGTFNGDVSIFDKVDEDEIIAIMTNKARYIKGIVAVNKIDTSQSYKQICSELSKRFNIEIVPVSALSRVNIEKLKEAIYKNSEIMRVWTKAREDSKESPVTLGRGASLEQLAKKIHTKFAEQIKGAYITGPSVKFKNQRVSSKHILMDGDIITFIRER